MHNLGIIISFQQNMRSILLNLIFFTVGWILSIHQTDDEVCYANQCVYT